LRSGFERLSPTASAAVQRRGRRLLALAIAWAAPAAALAPLLMPAPASAQYQAPSDKLLMTAGSASTWRQGETDILVLEGPVSIEFERATLSAKQAVLWLSPEDGPEAGRMKAQVVLIGDGKVVQDGAIRSGERMLVNASVAGRVRLTAGERAERDLSGSDLYRTASAIRDPAAALPPVTQPATAATLPATRPATQQTTVPAAQPATLPTTQLAAGPTSQAVMPAAPVFFDAPEMELIETDDGTVAAVLSRGVKLLHKRANGDLLEVQGQRVVLFTPIRDLRQLQKSDSQIKEIQDAVTSAYVEGDARVVYTPADQSRIGEQRLGATRLYYEFTTDRAILTDAVLRTLDPKASIPIIVHAKTLRQLAAGEYTAEQTQLSTSAFAVPTYSIRAEKIYVRQDPGGADQEARSTFAAENTTFRAFGVPFFWLPYVGGDLTNLKTPLRSISGGHSSAFGVEARTEWGLFETFGQVPPRDLDLSYQLDYYTERGPGGGLNGKYQGGSVFGGGKEPWSFEGEFESYFVHDRGKDEIGRYLVEQQTDDLEERLRGHVLWEHQHILPDNWQTQIRAGFVSDPTFLEQWFPRQYDRELPHDVSFYLKRQQENEAFTALAQFQPNEQVTTGDLAQEQFEVEHLPEIGYRRIGENLGPGTLYSNNLVSGLHFQASRYSLQEQGYYPNLGVSPGIPSLGTTGVTDDTIWRGDFRQQVNFPFSAGPFRVTPYVMGRYTAYSDSPEESTVHRLFGGLGARITTAFWKVDDTVENRLLDIHRMRHVIEPEVNVFTSATTADRGDVYVFDEQIDAVNDVSAVQLALHQRWQTYRGGPGRWRSVDFLTLNLEANLFSNQPDDFSRRPVGFRGLYFPSLPETSIPRNSINGDMTWRIADTTALLADAQWNLDEEKLATASIGMVVQRDERMTYFIGTRYIEELESNITTFAADYQVSSRYNVAVAQAFDFGVGENVVSSASVIRKFDTLFIVVKGFYNQTTGQSGFGFSIVPRGLGTGVDSDVVNTTLETSRR